jgi:UDP-N-acetylhexosamine pyrophosphorylase
MEKRMKIWEDDNQKYIKAMMEKNTTEQNEKLTKRLEEIDFSVLEHIERKETVNERGVFAPLDAVEVSEIEARGAEFKELGLKAIREGKVGAVLLAGGQGTRLGLDRPKGTLNIGVAKELYLFEQLLRNLMDVTDEAGVYVPLYIMTSNINNADTTAFFEEHDYFGYPKDYVKFFVQEMVPACDYEGRIYMESQTEVAMSPNGNGGWFSSMVNAGLLSDIKERGIEWINVFAVDNCLQRIADPMFVGATIAYGCESGAKVVRKAAPDERVGVLCTEDGKPSIAEYYEMTEEMATARKENGDLKYGFGVILNYLFSEKKLEQIAEARMPIHVVEKKIPYMDVDGTFVKPEQPNGYKFETLVLDMVHMMDDCIPYEVVREREFAPIKNLHGVDSLDSARELMKGCGIEL